MMSVFFVENEVKADFRLDKTIDGMLVVMKQALLVGLDDEMTIIPAVLKYAATYREWYFYLLVQ
jgi:hypothetical protein